MSQLAYILITPYSLLKSRTGGIIARILSNNDLELKAVRMYAPSDAMVDDYIKAIKSDNQPERVNNLFIRYAEENLRKDNPSKISNRCVLLLFEGQNAANEIKRAVGYITYKSGDTVRITYGDYVVHGDELVYFEPAVLCAPTQKSVESHLQVFKKYAVSDGGVVTNSLTGCADVKDGETTLVMVKPDNFQKRSTRPGNIIDMFSKTGLYIVGSKLMRFSVAQAEEFYKPLKRIFEQKLEAPLRGQIEEILTSQLDVPVFEDDIDYIARRLRKNNAIHQFNQIIEYISGINPEHIPKEKHSEPGRERCLCLLYYGENAISSIRRILGNTDPSAAEGGTVRSEFGHDVLKNGVHASDSPKNAMRERKIVGLVGGEKSDLDDLIEF